jgi:hypothetical protein
MSSWGNKNRPRRQIVPNVNITSDIIPMPNKNNDIINDIINDQKLYTYNGKNKNNLFILTHYELGDMINCSPIITYYSKIYDTLKVVCGISHLNNMNILFNHIKNIEFIPLPTYKYDNTSVIPIEELNIISNDYDMMIIGYHNLYNNTNNLIDYSPNIPFKFYDDSKVNYSLFWDNFIIPPINNDLYTLLKSEVNNNYIFIHSTYSKGKLFSTDTIKNKFGIDFNSTLCISVDNNIYDESHPYYNIAGQFVGKPFFDYINVIINAKIIIISDSSFFSLAIHLPIKTKDCYVIPRNNLNNAYDYLFNEPYKSNDPRLAVFKTIVL